MKKQERYKRDIRRVLKNNRPEDNGAGVAQAVIDHIANQTYIGNQKNQRLYDSQNDDSAAVCNGTAHNTSSGIPEPWDGFCEQGGLHSTHHSPNAARQFHHKLDLGSGLIDGSICYSNLVFVTTKNDIHTIHKKDTESVIDLKNACTMAIRKLPNLVDDLNEKIKELKDKEFEYSYLKGKIEDAKDDLK